MNNKYNFICIILFWIVSIFAQDGTQINHDNNFKIDEIYYNECSSNFLDDKEKRELLGGKAYNLEIMQKVCEINIPSWFCITSYKYEKFLKNNSSLNLLISKLENLRINFDKNADISQRKEKEKQIYDLGKDIQKIIINSYFSKKFENLIANYVKELGKSTIYNKEAYVVRSSATIEDSAESSFAGLFDSYLNLNTVEDILAAIKSCYASVFNDRVIEHCLYNDLQINSCKMAVIVQKMIDATVSGTAFNLEMSTNTPVISIMSNYGIGSIVEGDSSGDNFIINPMNFSVIKRTLGNKYSYNSTKAISGVIKSDIPFNKRNEYNLNIGQAKKIAKGVVKLSEYLNKKYDYKFIDTEFAIDKDNRLYFVQSRPIVMNNIMSCNISTNHQSNLQKLITGKHSVSGISSGKVKIVEKFEDLESGKVVIEEDDILVTHRSTNYFTPYLTKFKGIVTIDGDPTSHPVLIARERGIPCVIGVTDAIKKLRPYEGEYITIDGSKKTIYLGHLEESDIVYSEIGPELQIVPKIDNLNEEKVIEDLLLRNRLKKDFDGYWLINPKSKLSGTLLEMQEKSHYLRIFQINKARASSKIDFNVKTRIYDDQVYAYWDPLEEQMKMYEGMSIDDCECFLLDYEKTIQDYIEISNLLKYDPSLWNKYVDVTTNFYGYMWQSFLYKFYINIKTADLANKLKLPLVYFEEFCVDVQKKFVEEDIVLKKDASKLAFELRKLCMDNNINFEEISLEKIKIWFPEMFENLVSFSKKYKFSQSEDFYNPPPIQQAFYVVKSIPQDYQTYDVDNDFSSEYFVDNQELKRWIEVGVKAKLIHNNAHHVRMRGVWQLREFLLPYGDRLFHQGIYDSNLDILKTSCKKIEEILKDNL